MSQALKVGTETGSLMNHLYSSIDAIKPKVGMGITELCWSDRHAGTITRISPSGKTFWYTQDTATRTDSNGMCEQQEYSYKSNPKEHGERRAFLTKRGWRHDGTGILLGRREEYHDYSF